MLFKYALQTLLHRLCATDGDDSEEIEFYCNLRLAMTEKLLNM
jgi:hypothetical protein